MTVYYNTIISQMNYLELEYDKAFHWILALHLIMENKELGGFVNERDSETTK